MRQFQPFIFLAVIAALCGCTNHTQNFGRYTNDEVWTAMLAVANNPDYDDPDTTKRWTVRENEVWTDEPAGRIEIHRKLERILVRPKSKDLFEHREWRFAVTLNRTDNPGEREVEFISRGPEVPARADREAWMYFTQVREVLGEHPRAVAEAEAQAAASQPAKPVNNAVRAMQTERR